MDNTTGNTSSPAKTEVNVSPAKAKARQVAGANNKNADKVTTPVAPRQTPPPAEAKKENSPLAESQAPDREDSSVRRGKIRDQIANRLRKEFGLAEPPVEKEETPREKEEEPKADGVSENSSVDSQESKQAEEEKPAPEDKKEESEVKTSETEASAEEKTEEASSGATDELAERASQEGIDPNLTKEAGIRKLLKSLNKEHALRRQAEEQLKKQQPTIAGNNEPEWTEELAGTRKAELQKALTQLQDLLDGDVKRDEEGKELPIEINGQKFVRKDLRQFERKVQEELSSLPGKVEAFKQIAKQREDYDVLAATQIEWYADADSPVRARALEAYNEVLSKGVRNVPFAQYVWAKGFDAIYREAQASKKEAVVVKKAEPKKTPVANTQTPSAKIADTAGSSNIRRLDSLLKRWQETGDPKDKQAYYVEKTRQRLNS